MPLLTRRELLTVPGLTMLAGLAERASAEPVPDSPATPEKRPRVACVITEYRDKSHADWIVQKLLDGYWYNSRHTPSRVEVASMYVDTFPGNDLSRACGAARGIPISPTVAGALTPGGKGLAVDGVVLIGEHGNYHKNVRGQKYYPRWWLYQQIVAEFRRSGRCVPVFSDKHFSTDWDEAKWMYDQSRELGFPLMAGSSVPVCHRSPEIELPLDTRLERAVVVSNGDREGGGCHSLEALQCMVERRRGGETGVASVQCIEGPEVWTWTDKRPWAQSLFDAALARIPEKKPGDVREMEKSPILFVIEYRDGLQAAVYMINRAGIMSWAFAGGIKGENEPVSTQFWFNFTPGKYLGSSTFVHYITEMVVTGKEPYPPERTLCTTGLLTNLVASNWENGRYRAVGRRVETPFLDIRYRAGAEPVYDRGSRPPDLPLDRGF